MKVYEKIDKVLQFSPNDIKLLEYIIPKVEIKNDIELPYKNKHFFDKSEHQYFVTIRQKELTNKFNVSQTKISNRLKELCEFRALQKFSRSTYLVDLEYLMSEYIDRKKAC